MHDRTLPPSVLETFRSHLQHAERSPSTIATKISSEGVNLDKQAFNAS